MATEIIGKVYNGPIRTYQREMADQSESLLSQIRAGVPVEEALAIMNQIDNLSNEAIILSLEVSKRNS